MFVADSSTSSSFAPSRKQATGRRRGIITVLSAFLMVFMMGMIAFAVDMGFMVNVRTEAQRVADSTALAAAGAMVNGTSAGTTEAQKYLGLNPISGVTLTNGNMTIEYGKWNTTNMSFTVTSTNPNAVRSTVSVTNAPLFFGKVFNKSSFNMTGQAIAMYQPRDIVMALDYSGSMTDDSKLQNIGGALTKTSVEAALANMKSEVGMGTMGSLSSTLGSAQYSSTSTSQVIKNFGLDKVNWPYADGSWTEYVDYVKKSSSNSLPSSYQHKYGYVTLFNYILDKNMASNQCSVLWKASEQPLTAVKDAVDVFLSYLTANSTDDRVGFVLYTSSNSTATVEQTLTSTFSNVSTKVRQRQAGHYVGGTNIYDGLKAARVELQNNARAGAFKMIILMTDGVANLPTGNSTTDKNSVITESTTCGNANIPIVAISVGAGADTSLMSTVASNSGGAAFTVAGGQTVAAVKAQLEGVFGQVAGQRPLKLVK